MFLDSSSPGDYLEELLLATPRLHSRTWWLLLDLREGREHAMSAQEVVLSPIPLTSVGMKAQESAGRLGPK